MLGGRPQAQLRIRLALGPAQVRSQNHPRLVLQRIFDGGQRFANAGVVGDLPALIQGDVEIHADLLPLFSFSQREELVLTSRIASASATVGGNSSKMWTWSEAPPTIKALPPIFRTIPPT